MNKRERNKCVARCNSRSKMVKHVKPQNNSRTKKPETQCCLKQLLSGLGKLEWSYSHRHVILLRSECCVTRRSRVVRQEMANIHQVNQVPGLQQLLRCSYQSYLQLLQIHLQLLPLPPPSKNKKGKKNPDARYVFISFHILILPGGLFRYYHVCAWVRAGADICHSCLHVSLFSLFLFSFSSCLQLFFPFSLLSFLNNKTNLCFSSSLRMYPERGSVLNNFQPCTHQRCYGCKFRCLYLGTWF